MKILHIAPLDDNKASGLNSSIPVFVKHQNEIEGIISQILISTSIKPENHDHTHFSEIEKNMSLNEFFEKYDIIIFHSTYIFKHIKFFKIIKKLNIPYIIVPHGGFTIQSKKVKRMKKFFGDLLIFRKFFDSPSAIHFLTENEKKHSLHGTKNDFVIPNGITNPKTQFIHRQMTPNIKFVYIGRIDLFVKGLDLLVEATNLIQNELRINKAEIIMYGPDSLNSIRKLKSLIISFNVEDIIIIKNEVYDFEKYEILKEANCFIQTSRTEGLPMGVLEALSFGLPCILTPGTNISDEIDRFNAGISVEQTPLSISNGILSLIQRLKAGEDFTQKSISLSKKYSWDSIASESIVQYKDKL